MTDMTGSEALASIIEMSLWVGDPQRDLVILAEGNTSIKVGDGLLVKASGTSLETAEAASFVEVEREPLVRMIEAGTATDQEVSDGLKNATRWGTKKPSVETLLHIVCQEYDQVQAVIHTHPTPVNSMLCSTRAAELVRASYFPDQIVSLGHNPMLIEYIDPGLPLAHSARSLVRDHAEETGGVPKVIYLANHGMFALGGTVAEAKQITQMAVKSARVLLGALSVGDAVALSEENAKRIHTRPDEIFRRAALKAEQAG